MVASGDHILINTCYCNQVVSGIDFAVDAFLLTVGN
jgi:hypothetical protein